MRIVIAGAGEVGTHLAKMLSNEEQDIIVMDTENRKLEPLENYNLLTHQGSAISFSDLNAIKTGACDLFIAVTKSEARNILSCSMAKRRKMAFSFLRHGHRQSHLSRDACCP